MGRPKSTKCALIRVTVPQKRALEALRGKNPLGSPEPVHAVLDRVLRAYLATHPDDFKRVYKQAKTRKD